MTIIHLLEYEYHRNSFKSLLKNIQDNFSMFTAILTHYYDDFVASIPLIAHWIDTSTPETKAHSFARCYTTRAILDELFGISKWYTYNQFRPDDMKFRIISIGGMSFPDHTFIIMYFREEIFVLQSYFFAYQLSGKYGILELNNDSLRELDDILHRYTALQRTEPNAFVLANLATRFSIFTGIDPKKSLGNTVNHAGQINYITDVETYANSECVFKYLQKRIAQFEGIIFNRIINPPPGLAGSPDDDIRIAFEYRFSDAFIHSAYTPPPSIRFTSIFDLPEVLKPHAFKLLVGTDYPAGNAMGVQLGEIVHVDREYYNKIKCFVSKKTIIIKVYSLVTLFDSLKQKIIPLLTNSKLMNLSVIKSFPFPFAIPSGEDMYTIITMGDTILLDEDRQELKNNYARSIMATLEERRIVFPPRYILPPP